MMTIVATWNIVISTPSGTAWSSACAIGGSRRFTAMSRSDCFRRTGRATSAQTVSLERQKWRNKAIAPYGRSVQILVGRNCFIAQLRTNPESGTDFKRQQAQQSHCAYKTREARDEQEIKANTMCRRAHHGAAHRRRLRATR